MPETLPSFTPAKTFTEAASVWRHPVDVAMTIIGLPIKDSYKLTELTRIFHETVCLIRGVPASQSFLAFCDCIKCYGKLEKTVDLFDTINNVGTDIFTPDWNKNPLSNTDGYSGHWYTKPLYVIKIVSVTTGSILETYTIGKKYLAPGLFNSVGEIFSQNMGAIALKIGGEGASIWASGLRASEIKNYAFMIFLTFEGAQSLYKYYQAENKVDTVHQGMKALACFAKVGIIGVTIFGQKVLPIPKPITVGLGVMVHMIDVSCTYNSVLKANAS